MLDGTEIVAILTEWSKNTKTGPMGQIWILNKDIPPNVAVKTGEDRAMCGTCPLRGGACYVRTEYGPLNIWKAYKAGKYMALPEKYTTVLPVRWGAYGDIAALPEHIQERVKRLNTEHTSYTHQWREFDLQAYNMASVESLEQREEAKRKGYRTFRIMKHGDKPREGEILCPNDRDKSVLCMNCLLCQGNKKGAKDICTYVHGSKARINKFEAL